MANQEYLALLKDPRWQRKRLEILQSRNWKCELMGETEFPLNVHHRRYIKGAMPWEYSDDQLQVLCEECHKDWHEWNGRRFGAASLLESVGERIGSYKTKYTDGSWEWSWVAWDEGISPTESAARIAECERLERRLERFKKFASGEVRL